MDGWTVTCTTGDCDWQVADSARRVVVQARDAHTRNTGHRQFTYLHGPFRTRPL